MRKKLLFLFLFVCAAGVLSAQVKLYEDQFNGGVTGSSYSTGVDGTGSGTITLHIDPASTIRKAYLIVGRLGPAPAVAVTLNSMLLTFDVSNQVTPDFQCALYGGLSAVHAIDITSQVSPAVNQYNISYAQGGAGANFFTDFYMYVAYENNSMSLVNTVIFLKTLDFQPTEPYTLGLANPVDTMVPIGFAMHAGYMCDGNFDGENVTIAGTFLGTFGGGDPYNPAGVCSGTSGSFYYENNMLFGLNGDSADQIMQSADALSDLKNVLPNNEDTFDVVFEHFGGGTSSPDNSMWGWIMTYGNSNALPTAVFSSPNHICPGTCTDFTNLSQNATGFIWSFPGGNPAVSTDVNPTGICYNTPGQYNVELIATNSNGSDTLMLPNYITVFPFPSPQGILQGGDTLYANAGAVSYQWYYNGSLIAGATDSFYVAPQSGNYNVVATDANGCEVEAAIFDVIASISPLSLGEGSGVRLYPNPVNGILEIRKDFSGSEISISIYNMIGAAVKMQTAVPVTAAGGMQSLQLDVSSLTPGIYMLEMISGSSIFNSRFIKK